MASMDAAMRTECSDDSRIEPAQRAACRAELNATRPSYSMKHSFWLYFAS